MKKTIPAAKPAPMYIHPDTHARFLKLAEKAGHSRGGRSGMTLAGFIDRLLDRWEGNGKDIHPLTPLPRGCTK